MCYFGSGAQLTTKALHLSNKCVVKPTVLKNATRTNKFDCGSVVTNNGLKEYDLESTRKDPKTGNA
jgi:hypothetical protein